MNTEGVVLKASRNLLFCARKRCIDISASWISTKHGNDYTNHHGWTLFTKRLLLDYWFVSWFIAFYRKVGTILYFFFYTDSISVCEKNSCLMYSVCHVRGRIGGWQRVHLVAHPSRILTGGAWWRKDNISSKRSPSDSYGFGYVANLNRWVNGDNRFGDKSQGYTFRNDTPCSVGANAKDRFFYQENSFFKADMILQFLRKNDW